MEIKTETGETLDLPTTTNADGKVIRNHAKPENELAYQFLCHLRLQALPMIRFLMIRFLSKLAASQEDVDFLLAAIDNEEPPSDATLERVAAIKAKAKAAFEAQEAAQDAAVQANPQFVQRAAPGVN